MYKIIENYLLTIEGKFVYKSKNKSSKLNQRTVEDRKIAELIAIHKLRTNHRNCKAKRIIRRKEQMKSQEIAKLTARTIVGIP